MEITKIIIVKCSNDKYWYKNLKGKKFHVYGTIDEPNMVDGNFLICAENSASIYLYDVIFIK